MARRHGRKKRRGRGRFSFLYQVLSCVLIIAALTAGCAIFFRVATVEVEGESPYTHQEIIAATQVTAGDNLFLLNKYRIAGQVLKALPYIDELVIRRDLPDTLCLSVTECIPTAVIAHEGTWWLLDAKGKLLEGQREAPAALTVVTGVTPILPGAGEKLALGDADSGKLRSLVELLAALAQRDMAKEVQSIDLSGTSDVVLGYQERLAVHLPLYGDFPRKVRNLQAAAELLTANEHGTLDLTGDKGFFRPQ